jgi:hypothetical protein
MKPLIVQVEKSLPQGSSIQVAVVQSDGSVQLRNVSVGRDFGKTVEILSGVTPADRVVVNPTDSLVSGVLVRVAETPKAVARK